MYVKLQSVQILKVGNKNITALVQQHHHQQDKIFISHYENKNKPKSKKKLDWYIF